MEVLTNSASPILIPNQVVLSVLEERVAEQKEHERKRNKRHKRFQHRDWIQDKVIEYLKDTPCVQLEVGKISELKEKLTHTKRRRGSTSVPTGFGLTDAEALQIVNFMPTEPVEMHLMVEELHDRMPETQQEDLLATVKSFRSDAEDKA